VIQYRPFLNTDPTLIVDIWRHQPPFRCQFSAVTRAILDQHIFSKTYFDRFGLILAVLESDGETKPLGFVHAGFAPNAQLSDLDLTSGILSQLKVVPGEHADVVGQGLLGKAMEYLKQRGASVASVGSKFPRSPFYMGLYGGSRIPGVMQDDEPTVKALTEFGFQTDETVVVMERALTGFRTVIDREQMALRRQFQIKAIADPIETSWWESCTFGMAERDRFNVSRKQDRECSGGVSFWDIQPLASEWGVTCRGMYDLEVAPELRRQGMATFLVGESLRHLMLQGIGRVQVQVRESDAPSLGVFRKLGFEPITQGYLMSKSI
jgi:GNAT superfamily N-acetyltransferase